MHKKMMIACLGSLLIGCSAKHSTVQSSAIAGGTVGVLAGAVMGSTLALANGETGNKLATKAVIFGVLVGLAGAGIGASVAYTKEIFGGEEEEANQKIEQAIEKANQPSEKTKIYHNEEKESKQNINHVIEESNQPEERIKIYHKEEIVDVTDRIDGTEHIEKNETNDESVDTSNQVNTIEDEPISVSTDTSTALKEAYSKEIE